MYWLSSNDLYLIIFWIRGINLRWQIRRRKLYPQGNAICRIQSLFLILLFISNTGQFTTCTYSMKVLCISVWQIVRPVTYRWLILHILYFSNVRFVISVLSIHSGTINEWEPVLYHHHQNWLVGWKTCGFWKGSRGRRYCQERWICWFVIRETIQQSNYCWFWWTERIIIIIHWLHFQCNLKSFINIIAKFRYNSSSMLLGCRIIMSVCVTASCPVA